VVFKAKTNHPAVSSFGSKLGDFHRGTFFNVLVVPCINIRFYHL